MTVNIQLTPDYRLTADERNYIVLRRVTVDPTSAPNWKARLAADPTLDGTPREEWCEDGYYPLTASGLRTVIDHVTHKTVSASDIGSLTELLAAIDRHTDAIQSAIPDVKFTGNFHEISD